MLHLDSQSVLLNALRTIDEERARELMSEEPAVDDLRRTPPVPSERMRSGGIETIVDTYNEALRRLFSAVSGEVKQHIRGEIRSFLGKSSALYKPLFAGVEVGEGGMIDRKRLLQNLAELGDEGGDQLQVGLSELLFFVLFAAGDAVEDQARSGLHRGVAEAMRGLGKHEL
jgi:hypothetical protein